MGRSKGNASDEKLFEAFLERELGRRAVLKELGAGAALAAFGLACRGDESNGGRDAGHSPDDAGGGRDAGADLPDASAGSDSGPQPDASAGSPVVAVARAASREEAIERAVTLAGGLGFIGQDASVLIKPNCNSGDLYPYSTHPDAIRKVVAMVRDRGAARVIVADRSFYGASTAENMRQNGVGDLAAQLGVEIPDWDTENDEDWIEVPSDQAPDWGMSGFRFPRVLAEVDHIISMPVMKTHFLAYFTMGLKNWIGITAGTSRQFGLDHGMPNLARCITQIHTVVTPSLLVLDGTQAVVQGGPTPFDPPGGEVRDADIVVASTDRIALDVTGVAILKFLGSPATEISSRGVWEQPQITAAIELGLGISGPDQYELVGDGVDELEQIRQIVLGA